MNKQPTRKLAKMCTTHIGGRLGRLLMEQFAVKGWITRENPNDKFYVITRHGEEEFGKLGIDLSQIKSE
ncbi:MAG TPA: hypothetical protein VHI78_05555 [Bacteroidales bacterium]|jgi:DNA-binding PadR family transcriptional regulator|nr:hypothetical protein [Bacteroidales bacterium]